MSLEQVRFPSAPFPGASRCNSINFARQPASQSSYGIAVPPIDPVSLVGRRASSAELGAEAGTVWREFRHFGFHERVLRRFQCGASVATPVCCGSRPVIFGVGFRALGWQPLTHFVGRPRCTTADFPGWMVSWKAIEIANALPAEAMDDGRAIRIATARPKQWAARRGLPADVRD